MTNLKQSVGLAYASAYKLSELCRDCAVFIMGKIGKLFFFFFGEGDLSNLQLSFISSQLIIGFDIL